MSDVENSIGLSVFGRRDLPDFRDLANNTPLGGCEKVGVLADMLPEKLSEIRKCRLPGGTDADALFLSKKWGRSITRTI